MLFSISPGYVYVFSTKSNTAVTKVGKAETTEATEFLKNLVDPNLQLQFCKFFLDADAAFSHLNTSFAAVPEQTGVYAAVPTDVVTSIAQYASGCKVYQESFNALCQKLNDHGHLKLDTAEEVLTNHTSALATILAFVPSDTDGRSIRELVLEAFNDSTDLIAIDLLTNAGLIPHFEDSLILLDKRIHSRLAYIFKGTACETSWPMQLNEYAGFTHTARAVPLDIWLDFTRAGSELVDLVSPLVCPE